MIRETLCVVRDAVAAVSIVMFVVILCIGMER